MEFRITIAKNSTGNIIEINYTAILDNNGNKQEVTQYYVRHFSSFADFRVIKHHVYWYIAHMNYFPTDMTLDAYDRLVFELMQAIKDMMKGGSNNDTRLVRWQNAIHPNVGV